MTIPNRLYIPLTAFENYSEKYPKLEFEGAYVGDDSETYVRESALKDTHIRRDDPALRQVMESLTFLEKQLDSHGFNEDGPMLCAASGALAAMQDLIGGNDG